MLEYELLKHQLHNALQQITLLERLVKLQEADIAKRDAMLDEAMGIIKQMQKTYNEMSALQQQTLTVKFPPPRIFGLW